MKEFVKLVDVKKIYQSGDVVTKAVDGKIGRAHV